MSGHDLLYPGPQDRIRTWGRLTMVIAGLEGHVQLRPPSLSPRAFERRDLGMVAAGMGVPALSDHRTVAHHDRSHQRVRLWGVGGRPGGQKPPHDSPPGAGISPAPESYLKLSYHTATVRTR